MTRMNIDAKVLFNQKDYILKAKRTPAIEIKEIKENVRLKIGNDTQEYTKGVIAAKWIQKL